MPKLEDFTVFNDISIIDQGEKSKFKETWGFSDSDEKGAKKPDHKKTLVVKYAATHAGRRLNNGSFYLPTEMRKAVKTMTSPTKIPLLKNHNWEGEPLGRVIGARFVNTSQAFLNKNPKYQAIMDDNSSLDAKRKLVNQLIVQTARDKDDFKGLGYIQAHVNVLDSDAQNKFMDERYTTPSTYFTATDVMCNICGHLIVMNGELTEQDGQGNCTHEHSYGDTDPDTGAPFTRLPLGFTYKEISNVNIPRDELAGVEELQMVDSIEAVSIVKNKDGESHVYNLAKDFKDAEVVCDEVSCYIKPLLGKEEPMEKNTNPNPGEKLKKRFSDWYQKIIDSSEDEKKELFKIQDSDIYFAGKNKTFPANTVEQAQNSLSVIEKYKDEEGEDEDEEEDKNLKAILVEAVTERIKSLAELTPEDKRTEDTWKMSDIINSIVSLIKQLDGELDKSPSTKDFVKSIIGTKFADAIIPMDKINDAIDAYAATITDQDEEYKWPEDTETKDGETPVENADADKAGSTKDNKKAGGSNAGKYSKKEGPFCGPSGGAPAGTYPVNTLSRAKAAIKLSGHAPKPEGIKACARRHWPQLKENKGDSDEKVLFENTSLLLQNLGLADSNEQVVDKLAKSLGISYHNDDKSKDLLIDSLKAQLDSEKNVTKKLQSELIEARKKPSLEDAPKVDNPVLQTVPAGIDADKKKSEQKKDFTDEYKLVYQEYTRIRDLRGKGLAVRYLDSLKNKGILPVEVTFE